MTTQPRARKLIEELHLTFQRAGLPLCQMSMITQPGTRYVTVTADRFLIHVHDKSYVVELNLGRDRGNYLGHVIGDDNRNPNREMFFDLNLTLNCVLEYCIYLYKQRFEDPIIGRKATKANNHFRYLYENEAQERIL